MDFFLLWGLMPLSWKGLIAMLICLLTPALQGTLGNAQFSCNLPFWLVARACKLHGLVRYHSAVKVGCGFGTMISFVQNCLPHSTTLSNRGKITSLLRRGRECAENTRKKNGLPAQQSRHEEDRHTTMTDLYKTSSSRKPGKSKLQTHSMRKLPRPM